MFYEIAGIKVAVEGSCSLADTFISYEKKQGGFLYARAKQYVGHEMKESSGELVSPDDPCFTIGEQEQDFIAGFMKDNEADTICVPVRGSACCDASGNSAYVLRRMQGYAVREQSATFVPDFSIRYKASCGILMPKGLFIENIRGFSVIRQENGCVSFIRTIPYMAEILVRIDFNATFDFAQIELFDVSGFGGIGFDERLHAYIGEAFAYMALKQNKAVFHSSAIAFDGKGICFSAPSGTGKSTHTGLWRKYYGQRTEMINDDTPLLFLDEIGNSVLSGTPWSGKTELNINKTVPLSGVVMLTRSKENYMKRLTGLDALRRFLAECKIPAIPELFDAGLSVAGRILEKTPVYLLGCSISKEAVDVVKDTLFP